MLASSAPPPVRTIPLSTISAASSGAVCSSAPFTASMIAPTGSARLSEICRSLISSSFGTPFIRSRPLISRVLPSLAALVLDDGDHRGFVEDDAPAPDVDERIGGSEIDRHVGRQEPE